MTTWIVPSAVLVTPASASIAVGASLQLQATLLDKDGNAIPGLVRWFVSPPGIATVDASGLVRGVAPGTAIVRAVSEVVGGSATVTVVPAPSGAKVPLVGKWLR